MTDAVLDREELLRRVEEGWREFRTAVRHLGIAGMKARSPTEWTYKDLVAHAAAWEEEAARRLRAFRKSGERRRWNAEVDAFNARAVEERSLVGAEAIVDELDTAHRLLLDEIAKLEDAQVRDSWTQHLVAGNTFEHYAEHRDELAARSA